VTLCMRGRGGGGEVSPHPPPLEEGREGSCWGSGDDRSGDRLRVQGLEGGFVFVWGDDAAHGVWGDSREELFLEDLLNVAGAGRGDD